MHTYLAHTQRFGYGEAPSFGPRRKYGEQTLLVQTGQVTIRHIVEDGYEGPKFYVGLSVVVHVVHQPASAAHKQQTRHRMAGPNQLQPQFEQQNVVLSDFDGGHVQHERHRRDKG